MSNPTFYSKLEKVKNLSPMPEYGIGGTDLGIPYDMSNGYVGYLFGDTFEGAFPGTPNWRSPVMLMSHNNVTDGIDLSRSFLSNSAGAAEIMTNGHNSGGEVSVIPNDGVSFPETGRQIVSYMSIKNWDNGTWRTHRMGLAYSDNGSYFTKLPWSWANNAQGTDVLQMTTMMRDGDYVYLLSTSNGRDIHDGLFLRRVYWDNMFDPGAYEHWTWNGHWQWTKNYHWHWHPILTGQFGEPSMRRLKDGRWAISVIDAGNDGLAFFTSDSIEGVWNKTMIIQDSSRDSIYGGFIHPWSCEDNVTLIISKWNSQKYGVEQWKLDASEL